MPWIGVLYKLAVGTRTELQVSVLCICVGGCLCVQGMYAPAHAGCGTVWQALCKNTGPSSIGSTMSLFLKVKVESVSELKPSNSDEHSFALSSWPHIGNSNEKLLIGTNLS